MAKQVFETSSGQKDPSALSDDFRFEFPIISLSKKVHLEAVFSFMHTLLGDFLKVHCCHIGLAVAMSGLRP